MVNILLVEDEVDLRFSLRHNLGFEGYAVVEAADGLEALKAYRQNSFDLIILDIMIPEMDGLKVLGHIREENRDIPIMMLTAKATEMDKVIGFELGADDYLTKPFGLGEFLARVKALLRRRRLANQATSATRFLDIEIDFENFTVTKDGEDIHFSQKEFQLLKFLIRHPKKALEKRDILTAVWGYKSTATTRTIDTHVARIRRKLRDQDANEIIQTVPTVGYKFVADLERG